MVFSPGNHFPFDFLFFKVRLKKFRGVPRGLTDFFFGLGLKIAGFFHPLEGERGGLLLRRNLQGGKIRGGIISYYSITFSGGTMRGFS